MAKEDWKKYIVPTAAQLTPGREPRGLYSYGPDELHLRENLILGGGPEEFVRNNPQLFATSSTSNYEGYAYWALLHIIGPEGQPGRNGATWYYQSKVAPVGRAGSAVVDFTVEGVLEGWILGIRVTSYFHTEFGSFKEATDFEQQFFLTDQGIYPVDADGERMAADPTGATAIKIMQESIDVRPDLSAIY